MSVYDLSYRCDRVNQYKIYPWIHQYNNHKSRDSQLEACTFPDRNPSDMPHNSNFSMAAGDFLDVYTDPGSSAALLQQYLSLRAQTFLSTLRGLLHVSH